MSNLVSRIEYIDSHHLKVEFSYLIIKVESVTEKFGLLSDFADKHDLYGYTNGRLYVLDEMIEPHDRLIDLVETILKPLGLIQNRDYALGFEEITRGVKDYVSELLDKDLPDLSKCDWLGSILMHEGNFVWYRDTSDWKAYINYRQEAFPQLYIGYFQMLLKKYYEERYPDDVRFEPTVIELRGDNVVFGLINQSGFSVIGKDVLNAIETI
jgi:hypothetical protein